MFSQRIHWCNPRNTYFRVGIIENMTESPEPRTEPTAAGTAPPPYRRDAPDEGPYRRNRLNAVLALVGIIAGTVFIIAVVFFSGFILGAHAGGGHHHHGEDGHHWHGSSMSHRGGPPMGQWQSPGGPGMMGPGGQMGPGGPFGPGATQSPTTAPSTTPHP
jgi:hypothetical protein